MTYNPSILDLMYLKLIPQGSLMTFRNKVYYTGSNAISNIWAKTSDAWALWSVFLTTTIVWDLLQTYSSILTNSINPIGGTLTIGNEAVNTHVRIATENSRSVVLHLGDGNSATSAADIRIGSGSSSQGNVRILDGTGSTGTITLGTTGTTTTLNCPLTPAYPYTIGTQVAPTIPSIGKEGAIGYVAPVTFIQNGLSSGSNGGGLSLRSVSLTKGIWLVSGSYLFPLNYTITNANINVAITLNNGAGMLFRKGTNPIAGLSNPFPRGMSTCGVINVSPVFPATTITYYLNGRSDTGGGASNIIFMAMRIA